MINLAKLLNLAGAKKLYYDLRDRIEGKYTKPGGGIPSSDIAPGVIPDPTEIIDDNTTSSDPKYNKKTFSAQKLDGDFSTLNSAINDKYTKPQTGIPASDLASGVIPSVPVQDVQVNGVSVLSQGVANVPMASDTVPGVVKVSSYNGITGGDAILYIVKATSAQLKAGANQYCPVVSYNQHESAFFGLAKAAGANMSSLSSTTVGVYPEAQKVAIQKMLGIYQAPWELIREDTVTNATSASYEITVDGNGNPFELTDIRFLFEFPNVNSPAQTDFYGQVGFYYSDTGVLISEAGSASRSASDPAKGAWHMLEYKNGMTFVTTSNFATNSNAAGLKSRFIQASSATSLAEMGIRLTDDFTVKKVLVKPVTGTFHYRLFGRRKWN